MLDEDIKTILDHYYILAINGDCNPVFAFVNSRKLGPLEITSNPLLRIVVHKEGALLKYQSIKANEYAATLTLQNIHTISEFNYVYDCRNCVLMQSHKEGLDEKGNLHIKK